MRKTLSIEELHQKIADHRTRTAMDEVLSCFYSKNLRSAVVMLYSTVVSDLYYKLQDLKEMYGDGGATLILEEIENKKTADPKSSVWEIIMPEMCMKQNKIIRTEDYIHYEALQKERNLCAHPVIDRTEDLYRPNPSYVQGLIINMMEGLLCKPSFVSKDLFEVFINDIARVSQELMSDDIVIKYVETKYLDKIDNPQEEYLLFKPLWKLVFYVDDDKCKENRKINYKVLLLLMERNKSLFLQELRSHPATFFKDASMPSPTRFESVLYSRWGVLVQFLNDYCTLQGYIPADFKMEMGRKINENVELSCLVLYDKPDILQYIIECVETKQYMMSYASISYLNNIVQNKYSQKTYLDFVITLYGHSPQFVNANWNYVSIVKNVIRDFTIEQLAQLISYMDANSQIYNSNEFPNAVQKVKERMESLNPTFDYTPYANFPQ